MKYEHYFFLTFLPLVMKINYFMKNLLLIQENLINPNISFQSERLYSTDLPTEDMIRLNSNKEGQRIRNSRVDHFTTRY